MGSSPPGVGPCSGLRWETGVEVGMRCTLRWCSRSGTRTGTSRSVNLFPRPPASSCSPAKLTVFSCSFSPYPAVRANARCVSSGRIAVVPDVPQSRRPGPARSTLRSAPQPVQPRPGVNLLHSSGPIRLPSAVIHLPDRCSTPCTPAATLPTVVSAQGPARSAVEDNLVECSPEAVSASACGRERLVSRG